MSKEAALGRLNALCLDYLRPFPDKTWQTGGVVVALQSVCYVAAEVDNTSVSCHSLG